MQFNSKYFNVLLLLFIPLFGFTKLKEKNTLSIESNCLQIHTTWIKEAFVLTKNSVGFSAPISARAYAYFSVGMYESNVEFTKSLQSLTNQLNGYHRKTFKQKHKKYNWPLISNSVDFEVLSYLYRTMPPSNAKHIQIIQDSISKQFASNYSSEINNRSLLYAKSIAKEIIDWSKLDGADEAFFNNYPSDYIPPKCASCWSKTTPGYQPALLPNWGKTKSILPNSITTVSDIQLIPFESDSNSALYKDALGIIAVSKSKNSEYERIAEYWDDAPGYTGTPSGHFFNMTLHIVEQQKITLDTALELYVKLGISLNEAFINCWRLKYAFNFIRPITYIHRFIDPQFNSLIASPSFPEFPSGHSFQSGAGSEVLKSIFTDKISFIDSTNFNRTDIDGTPQRFNSFSEMAEEISISRYYGGIHFRQTLDISLQYGKKIGLFVVKELKCRK